MQTNHLDIYQMTSEQTGKSEQMYKDLGPFIFKETSKMLKEPESLILKLKGVGTWYLRQKRMQIVVSEWPHRGIPMTPEQFDSELAYLNYMEKHLQYLNFQERLKDYERYLELKKQVRLKRNETQILLEPDKGEDERFKSGQD